MLLKQVSRAHLQQNFPELTCRFTEQIILQKIELQSPLDSTRASILRDVIEASLHVHAAVHHNLALQLGLIVFDALLFVGELFNLLHTHLRQLVERCVLFVVVLTRARVEYSTS